MDEKTSKPRIFTIMGEFLKYATSLFIRVFGVVLWGVNVIIMFALLVLSTFGSIIRAIMSYIPKIIKRYIPSGIASLLDQMLVYAGVNMTSEEVVSLALVYSVIVSSIVYVILFFIEVSAFTSILITLVVFISIWTLPVIIFDLLIYRRTESVEIVLPDVLDIIAQNMIAGMTSYNALWTSARSEFGPLAYEIQAAARATLTGTPLVDALIGITNRVKSEKLERSIRLMIQGMKSGGELPAVLQGIAKDMRAEQNLQKQMKAETSAHTLFILFAILIGAPLLFAISLQFITIFSTIYTKLNITELIEKAPMQRTFIMIRGLTITPDFFFKYAIAILFVSSFFSGLLIGMIRTGRPIAGIHNIPILIGISVGVFILINYILGIFFGSFFIT